MKEVFKYIGFVFLFAVFGLAAIIINFGGWPLAFMYSSNVGEHWLIFPYLINAIIYLVIPCLTLYLSRGWIFSGRRKIFAGLLLACWLTCYSGVTYFAVRHATPSWAMLVHFGNESLRSKVRELAEKPLMDADINLVKSNSVAVNLICDEYYRGVNKKILPVSLDLGGYFVSTKIETSLAEKWINDGLGCDDKVVEEAKKIRDSLYGDMDKIHRANLFKQRGGDASVDPLSLNSLSLYFFMAVSSHPDAASVMLKKYKNDESTGELSYRLATKGALKPHLWKSLGKFSGGSLADNTEAFIDARTWKSLDRESNNSESVSYFMKMALGLGPNPDSETLVMAKVDCRNKNKINIIFSMDFEQKVEDSLSVSARGAEKFSVGTGDQFHRANVFACSDKSNQIKVDANGWVVE